MIPALLLLPLLLKAAALHYLLGITILTALPILVLSYYYATHQRKRRGKWYLIGFATNSKWFINIKNTMKMGVATLVSTAEGDVDLSYASRGHRERKSNRAKKTDMPGKFTFVSWGSKNDIIVVDVKYDDYALVYDIKTKQKVNKIIHLYDSFFVTFPGRRDEVSANVKEKFKQLALDAGTLAENIVFLPKNEQ
uniref:Lipocalin/cytosolic fatty-acid binding domain-containing protein n=1 Tax=Xiphophorus couchianus TaxID=32473 RepID=A0A3B5LF42_9TELE